MSAPADSQVAVEARMKKPSEQNCVRSRPAHSEYGHWHAGVTTATSADSQLMLRMQTFHRSYFSNLSGSNKRCPKTVLQTHEPSESMPKHYRRTLHSPVSSQSIALMHRCKVSYLDMPIDTGAVQRSLLKLVPCIHICSLLQQAAHCSSSSADAGVVQCSL
jgi:hypothetical protein